ncbi:hypothetical protein PtA15_1A841 [Puccinia triticina]|uniref:Uncharacterized protein n=1 Tax=Puccinia triticina TaxID=208348 RepID=A0ABY7C913_9BASI|nr:uncharacterized protein PtA15_1A841 [Puccinia triticina]WAQ81499.1 hypothetical protein PtA15_1A841 [Puccinia triticina]WAR52379.1 hypothetical protein PtB15_1B820 [Puccinia triticina]
MFIIGILTRQPALLTLHISDIRTQLDHLRQTCHESRMYEDSDKPADNPNY